MKWKKNRPFTNKKLSDSLIVPENTRVGGGGGVVQVLKYNVYLYWNIDSTLLRSRRYLNRSLTLLNTHFEICYELTLKILLFKIMLIGIKRFVITINYE